MHQNFQSILASVASLLDFIFANLTSFARLKMEMITELDYLVPDSGALVLFLRSSGSIAFSAFGLHHFSILDISLYLLCQDRLRGSFVVDVMEDWEF